MLKIYSGPANGGGLLYRACTECERLLPVGVFAKRRSVCRPCGRAVDAQWKKDNKLRYIAAWLVRNARRRELESGVPEGERLATEPATTIIAALLQTSQWNDPTLPKQFRLDFAGGRRAVIAGTNSTIARKVLERCLNVPGAPTLSRLDHGNRRYTGNCVLEPWSVNRRRRKDGAFSAAAILALLPVSHLLDHDPIDFTAPPPHMAR